MLVVPILVAGPLTLMTWEHRTQPSSWWTLLSLQIPMGIWTLTKLMMMASQTTKTVLSNYDGGSSVDSARTATASGNVAKNKTRRKQQQHLVIRSIVVGLSTLFMCCRQPGLLCRGTGYLVPWMAEILLWVDILSSLLLGT